MSILKIKDKNGVFKGVHTVSGKSATIKVGEVVTGEPGTDARVENVGTESDAIFNFTIPRGKTGTGTGGGVSDYGSLDNLPSINGVTLIGNMNSEDIVGKVPVYLDVFDDMKEYDGLCEGLIICTHGYASVGDGGESKYLIKVINLYDSSTTIPYMYLSYDGAETQYNSFYTSDYISIEENKKYSYKGLTMFSSLAYAVYYDENKNFISSFNPKANDNVILTPQNAKYIRFSIHSSNVNTFYIGEGESLGDLPHKSDIVLIEGKFLARLLVDNTNTINIVQLGYLPNIPAQDCHDAISVYSSICDRDNKQYELFIPSGCWCFSETDIYNTSDYRKGVILRGVTSQASTTKRTAETTILPFNDNQKYIWNFGYTSASKQLVGGNVVKNFVFSTGSGQEPEGFKKSFCEVGVLLTQCCYSEFDGLYFHYFNGSGLCFQDGWENKFGYLNFRGVGYITKDYTYSALWFRANPAGNTPSGVSANYFDYVNFEGIAGNCIYAEPLGDLVHSEFNTIQVEWSHFDSYSADLTVTYSSEALPWDDESDTIEHVYIFKGSAAGNYNSIMFNTISVSGADERQNYTITWTDEEGTEHSRYKRKSGIFGLTEHYETNRYGLSVMVSKLSAVSDPNFPILHSPNTKGYQGINIIIGALERLKGYFKVNYANTNCNFLINNQTSDNNLTGKRVYAGDSNKTNLGLSYRDDSEHKYKLCIRGTSSTTEWKYKIDGTKKNYVRLYIQREEGDYSAFEMGGDVSYDNGVSFVYVEKIVKITQADFESGKYPINKWFEYEITQNAKIPFDNCIAGIRMWGPDTFMDYVEEKNLIREMSAQSLSNAIVNNIGVQAWCTDRRETAEDDLGVMMVFNGTEWKSIKGTKLTDLVS